MNAIFKHLKAFLIVFPVFVALFLSGCGGGGGSSSPPPAATPAATYKISGAVSGSVTSGVTLTLSGAAAATSTTDATGAYSFPGLANGNYTVTPSLAGNIFTPSQLAVSVSGANVTSQNFTAIASTATTYSISGSTGIAGATVSFGTAGSTLAGTGGAYTMPGLLPGTYTVTPTLTGYTFSPTSTSSTITAANVTGVNFTPTLIPVPHSISGTVSGAPAGVTIAVTGTATASTTTGTGGTYTVSGLYDGSYTLTPSLTGYTFNPVSTLVTLSGANVTGTNFTGTANSAVTATVSGTVTGPWPSGVTVSVSGGGASGSTTTNASGNYSFTLASGQTYTFTASLAGYTFTTGSATVASGSNAAVTASAITETSAVASYSISGTVSYAGTKAGPIYLRVFYSVGCTGCNSVSVAGTSIAIAGAYTIRGLQPGSYVVTAEMDTRNTGQPNAGNPAGSSATATITGADVSGANITVADPATPVPVTPALNVVAPGNGSAFIQYTPPVDANGREIAASYKVYWGTDTAASTGGTATFTANGTNQNVYFLSGLTDGTKLYFKMSALVGLTESAASAVFGPVTIGATAGANTVSGAVTFPGTATGPLVAGVYSNTGVYFTKIANPVSPQSYSVAGVPNGSYQSFAIIDMNSNGIIDTGDISNVNGNTPTITVAANTTSNLTLSSASATTMVNTDHWSNGTNLSYSLNLAINNGIKRVQAVTLFSGPNVAVPFDMGADTSNNGMNEQLGTTSPAVGDIYTFRVTYSDGTTQDLTGSVTGVLSSFATSLAVNTAAPYTRNVPQFTWAAPATPPASYTYRVYVQSPGGTSWNYPRDGGLPSSTLSAVYNADGNANPASLVTGTTYNWNVQVRDANRNSATFQAPAYTP